ncbi:tsukushi [Erpetoichthys calabaricus]|uniref:Tsukushi n=1 Tax=Erpetoichthys calabaricus TaxID=27687 RepID=A0A8C4X4H6_ERPCA|nr:tsukushi [Erpetoichthys calabaricus]XP_028655990.1 tsukushi [Erpetoichthys calabaricus]XP_028655991.1 tsukushi [Erpetoichthys calabaricus]
MDYSLVAIALLVCALHVTATRSCYPGCRCEVESFGLFDSFSLTKVDCSGVGPHFAPIPIPLDTSYLDLSSNALETITDSMLMGPGYTTLVSLDLSKNHIARVNSGSFSKLRYLETLNLSHNYLDALPDGCFSGLPLTDVDLSNNRLQEFRLDIFSSKGHRKPITVDLSNNRLALVFRDPHISSPNIKSLNLSGNKLASVPKLQNVPLRYLSLDGNPISVIEENSFLGLEDLSYLSLSGLPTLSVIKPNSFKSLPNLQGLDLSNNMELKSLSSEVFSGLQSLQELDLSNSGVITVPDKALKYLTNIRSITLGQNVLCQKTVKHGQFHRPVGHFKNEEVITCDFISTSL